MSPDIGSSKQTIEIWSCSYNTRKKKFFAFKKKTRSFCFLGFQAKFSLQFFHHLDSLSLILSSSPILGPIQSDRILFFVARKTNLSDTNILFSFLLSNLSDRFAESFRRLISLCSYRVWLIESFSQPNEKISIYCLVNVCSKWLKKSNNFDYFVDFKSNFNFILNYSEFFAAKWNLTE